jgi:hypothetical protein
VDAATIRAMLEAHFADGSHGMYRDDAVTTAGRRTTA